MQPSSESKTQAAPASLAEVPADAVAVVAAYAGFFDRAKLAVCSKHLSKACATVKSELLIVAKAHRREVYIADDSQWRRCADPPNQFWGSEHAMCIEDGKLCMVSDEFEKLGPHSCAIHKAQVYLYDTRRNTWLSKGKVQEVQDIKDYGCCAFEGNIVFVGGHKDGAYRPGEHNRFSRVVAVDPKTLVAEPMVSLPFPRSSAICGVADGKLFVLGGYVSNEYSKEPQEEQKAHEKYVLVLERRDGQEDAWAEFVELPPALSQQGRWVGPNFKTNVSFQDDRIFFIGSKGDWLVRFLDVRTKVWTTVEDTTVKAHWRRPRSSEYGFPEDLEDEDEWLEGGMMIRFVSAADRAGAPHSRKWGKGPAKSPVISYRGDFAVVLDDSDEEGEEEDMDRPGIYVLTGGNTWIQTGGRLGCSASREDQYDLFPEDVEVAAPPAWLQNMPVRLTRPWYSTWSTDRSVADADADEYQRYLNKMSHIAPGRFCVVTATSAPYDRHSELLAMPSVSSLMAELEKVRIQAPEKYGPLLESCVAEVNAALAKAQREKGLSPSV